MIEKVPNNAGVKEVMKALTELLGDWLKADSNNRNLIIGVGDKSLEAEEDPNEQSGLAMWIGGNAGMHAMAMAAMQNNLPPEIQIEMQLLLLKLPSEHFKGTEAPGERPTCCDKHKKQWDRKQKNKTKDAGSDEFAGLAELLFDEAGNIQEDDEHVH